MAISAQEVVYVESGPRMRVSDCGSLPQFCHLKGPRGQFEYHAFHFDCPESLYGS